MAAGVGGRRALAIEPLETRTLLSGSGFGTGTDDVAQSAMTSRHSTAVDPSGVAAPLARFTALGDGAINLNARSFAWRFGNGIGGGFSGGIGGGASQIAASRTTLFASGAAYVAQSSNVDRAFDLIYDASQPGWKLMPSATLEQMPRDKWSVARPKDNGMMSMSKDTMMGGDAGGDRMGGDGDSMQDMGNAMDGKMSTEKMRPIGSVPLATPLATPTLGGAISIGRADAADSRGDTRGDASNGDDGGFIALSPANGFSMSPAVASVFTQAAQRAAPAVVMAAESPARTLETADSDATDADRVDSRVANSDASNAIRRDDGHNELLPARSVAADGDAAAAKAADRNVDHAADVVDVVGDEKESESIANGPGLRVDDDARVAAGDVGVSEAADFEIPAHAYAWTYDEAEGGMIALAVAYLPGEVDTPRPAAATWLVEDARPRGEGDEARFDSSVGLYQVFDVATTMPPTARPATRPQQVIAAAMMFPPPASSDGESDVSTITVVRSEAGIGSIANWFGPNYAMAAASALAFSAGITFRQKRPLAAARRLVDRFRVRTAAGGK